MNLSISIDTWVCLCSIFIVFIFCSIIVFRYRNSEKLVANRRMVEFFPSLVSTLGVFIIRKSKCSTDFKRNDFLKKNEAYPLGALRSLKFAYRKLRISLFVELAV